MAPNPHIDDSDEQLISAITRSEHTALETLFLRYYKPLCHYLTLYLPDNTVAEELVSDLFVWIWQHRENLNIKNFRSYSYAAVKNYALDHKKIKQLPSIFLDSAENYDQHSANQPNPQQLLEDKEFHGQVMALISALPERQQQVFQLSRFSQMPASQIAEKLGISVRTVENTLYQAMRSLKKSFSQNQTKGI